MLSAGFPMLATLNSRHKPPVDAVLQATCAIHSFSSPQVAVGSQQRPNMVLVNTLSTVSSAPQPWRRGVVPAMSNSRLSDCLVRSPTKTTLSRSSCRTRTCRREPWHLVKARHGATNVKTCASLFHHTSKAEALQTFVVEPSGRHVKEMGSIHIPRKL